MHRRLRTLAALGASTLVLLLAAGPASAQTITNPTQNPYPVQNIPSNQVPNEPYGNALASFTIQFSGFAANTNVFVEECDGNAGQPGWGATIDCDNATSPAAVKSSATGTGTFTAYDNNFGFYPFYGPSPQNLFACVEPGNTTTYPEPVFTNCQLRVSTNNASTSASQVFLTLTTPAPAANVPETRDEVLLPVGALLLLGGAYVVARKRRRPMADEAS